MGLGLHSSSTTLKHGRHIQYGDYLMLGLTSHSAIEEDEDWDVWRVGAEEECSGCQDTACYGNRTASKLVSQGAHHRPCNGERDISLLTPHQHL